jgi:6-pyruvoyltetrahydropterin/6-carboxytetrahydropterin synthase
MVKECKYRSSKYYRQIGPVAYRQWRADSHCNLIHGYALSFYFEFESDTLDVRNWVQDFGGLKPLKEKLEDWFDHTLLVAQDDPQREELLRLGEIGLAKITEVEKTGCEGLADFLYKYVNGIFLPSYGETEAQRVWCCKVEVRETDSNMAMRVGHREDNEDLFAEYESGC